MTDALPSSIAGISNELSGALYPAPPAQAGMHSCDSLSMQSDHTFISGSLDFPCCLQVPHIYPEISATLLVMESPI